MDNFAKKFGDSFFAFSVGFFLFKASELPTWGAWMISIFVVLFALFSLYQFGQQALFWKMVQESPEEFGPEGEGIVDGRIMFDSAVGLVREYESRLVFWISLSASVFLMAGLLQHELYVPLVCEFAASVLGYAFIKSFLKNYHMLYGILNGSENSNA